MDATRPRPHILHAEPDGARGAVPLGLHEESSDPTNGCSRWPEHFRLRRDDGYMVRGRCNSPNKCGYCAGLAMMEHAEVLGIDAMTTGGPGLLAVLGTRSTLRDPKAFYRAREQVMRALRRRWPEVQYAALVEFTTGKGERSGGLRRPHWNLMLKGIPAGDVDQAREVIRRVWCDRVDALPAYQNIELVRDRGGIFKYLAKHFGKEEQAPPAGWAGHRFLHSRGYFPAGVAALRDQAREQLAFRRVIWMVEQNRPDHFDARDVHDVATEIHAERKSHAWKLHQIYELAGAPQPRVPPFDAYAAVAREGVRRCLDESDLAVGTVSRPESPADQSRRSSAR